jgi:hypothetical protein
MACAIGGQGNACRHHQLRSRGSCISARASAKDVMTVLGKRGDEGLVELGGRVLQDMGETGCVVELSAVGA